MHSSNKNPAKICLPPFGEKKQPEATYEYEESWNKETNDLVRVQEERRGRTIVRVPFVAARRLAIELPRL
jgi:hypothetical protein